MLSEVCSIRWIIKQVLLMPKVSASQEILRSRWQRKNVPDQSFAVPGMTQ